MTQDKVDLFVMTNHKYLPAEKIVFIKQKLADADDSKFALASAVEFKDPTTILLNCHEGSVFHDNQNLRLAVLHAIDFDQVRIAASGDFGFQGSDIAPAICGDYNKEWDNEPYYEYNVDTAKEYLQKAGYTPGNTGLKIHFMCKTMAPQMAAVAVVSLPLFLVFIFLRKYIMKGVSRSGIKG